MTVDKEREHQSLPFYCISLIHHFAVFNTYTTNAPKIIFLYKIILSYQISFVSLQCQIKHKNYEN